jgi:hypothetical protein
VNPISAPPCTRRTAAPAIGFVVAWSTTCSQADGASASPSMCGRSGSVRVATVPLPRGASGAASRAAPADELASTCAPVPPAPGGATSAPDSHAAGPPVIHNTAPSAKSTQNTTRHASKARQHTPPYAQCALLPSSAATSMTPFCNVAWRLLVGCAFAAALVFLLAAGQRVFYPHELEWMEGAMVDHSARVADGLPLYCAPGPEHVPFLYAPLMFWLGGLSMKLGLPGLLALRLVATAATIGTTMLIGHWVRRETGKSVPGLVAMGMFLGGYGWLAWWYDLARNDTLFVLPCLGAAYVLRHGTKRRWLLAAALATTAVLAKQSALMWLPAIGIGALCHDWRNALRFGAATLAGIAAVFALMHWTSDGWSTFFLFEMPRTTAGTASASCSSGPRICGRCGRSRHSACSASCCSGAPGTAAKRCSSRPSAAAASSRRGSRACTSVASTT